MRTQEKTLELVCEEEECPPTVRSQPSPIIPPSRPIQVEMVERKEAS